jgi:hypothetical protein
MSTIPWLHNVGRAIIRARYSIITIAAAYIVSILIGIFMVHLRNSFALDYRDRLVNQAVQQDPAAESANSGNPFKAALLDFSANLFLGTVPKTVSGLAILPPYPLVLYQGWIGGIVSVRGDHSSRLNDPRSAAYYLLTLLLQVTGFSLGAGAGINAGIAMFRPQPYYQGDKWLKLVPKEALRDLARIYVAVVPLLFLASLWEFLSPWNI